MSITHANHHFQWVKTGNNFQDYIFQLPSYLIQANKAFLKLKYYFVDFSHAHTVTDIMDENDNIHVLVKLPAFTMPCNITAQPQSALTYEHLFGTLMMFTQKIITIF